MDQCRLEITRVPLGDRDRRDGRYHATMGHRIGAENGADGETGDEHALAFAHRIGVAEGQRRKRFALEAQQCKIGCGVVGDPPYGENTRRLRMRSRKQDRDRFLSRAIERTRKHVRIGDDGLSRADREAGATKLEARAAFGLERPDREPVTTVMEER